MPVTARLAANAVTDYLADLAARAIAAGAVERPNQIQVCAWPDGTGQVVFDAPGAYRRFGGWNTPPAVALGAAERALVNVRKLERV